MIWKAILLWTTTSVDHSIETFVDHGIGTCVDHGIYITVIEINDSDSHGQVIIKSFSDDLVSALRSMNFNIPQDASPCEEQDFLTDYIDKHLRIRIDGNILDLKVNDCAIESDTHWVYIDFEHKGRFDSVEVETDWMTELFGNQQNIIKVKSGEQRLNDRLSSKKKVAVLEF